MNFGRSWPDLKQFTAAPGLRVSQAPACAEFLNLYAEISCRSTMLIRYGSMLFFWSKHVCVCECLFMWVCGWLFCLAARNNFEDLIAIDQSPHGDSGSC
jgi:hypothetical protein